MSNNKQPPQFTQAVTPKSLDQMTREERDFLDYKNEATANLIIPPAVVFTDPTNDEFVASGMFIIYRGRRFISTARHVATELFQRNNAEIAWRPPHPGGDYSRRSFFAVAHAWGQPDNGADIAALLLRDEAQLENAIFIDSGMLSTAKQPVPFRGSAWLVGSPRTTRTEDRARLNMPLAQSITRLTTHIRTPCLGTHSVENTHNVNDDIHVDASKVTRPGGAYRPMFHAGGMSGSSLWIDDVPETEFWSRDKLLVAGVAWWQDTECIMVVPMGLWFDAAENALKAAQTG